MGVATAQRTAPDDVHPVGGFVRRRRPGVGGRPTGRFVIAASLTVVYVGSAMTVSAPWRSDLEAAIGPVMAWVIPILLAYIPGLVIGFMLFTLITLRYRVPVPDRRSARGRPGRGRR